MTSPKALYIAYLTGVAGQGIGLFYIGSGVIAGVDAGAMKYEGSYNILEDGSMQGAIEYEIPAGVSLITGAPAGTGPTRITLKFNFPAGFDDGRVIAIETPLGPLNAKFEKLKEIP